MTVTVRFAPSPTGLLHVGNARVALINWLFARAHGGDFVLRLDDTDAERSRLEYEEAICRTLRWLGLNWEREEWQSRRQERYDEAIARLKAAGRLYACYETPEELEYKRKRLLARGLPPVYDRAGHALDDRARAACEAEGRVPHWRFLLLHEDVRWDDMVRGESHYRSEHLSDPVLIRADGTPLYTLPSVVDDIDFNITHVIRGEDHVTNTAAQIQLFRALGASAPVFGHLPLLTDAGGSGLSKRLGSASLHDLQNEGIEAMVLNSLLAKLGSSDPIQLRASLDQLVHEFDIGKFSRATPKFDPAELHRLNVRFLHEMPFSAVVDRLRVLGLKQVDEDFWNAVRPNLAAFKEAVVWWKICRDQLEPVIEDRGFSVRAATLLPAAPWDENTWGEWSAAVKEDTGRSGRALFHPLRLALTGRENGPELKRLLPLIGPARARARLNGEKA